MPLKDLGTLRPETEAQRDVQAKVTSADEEELRSRMESFKTPGEIANGGVIQVTSAAKTRAMFFAEPQSSGVFGEFMDWLKGQAQ